MNTPLTSCFATLGKELPVTSHSMTLGNIRSRYKLLEAVTNSVIDTDSISISIHHSEMIVTRFGAKYWEFKPQAPEVPCEENSDYNLYYCLDEYSENIIKVYLCSSKYNIDFIDIHDVEYSKFEVRSDIFNIIFRKLYFEFYSSYGVDGVEE